MRQIKFRARINNKKDWHYFDLRDNQQVKDLSLLVAYDLSQFTGLLDKHEEEIYEDDILKTESGVCYVAWHEKAAAFRFYFGGNAESPLNYEDIEVIGDTYQNNELLSEAKVA